MEESESSLDPLDHSLYHSLMLGYTDPLWSDEVLQSL